MFLYIEISMVYFISDTWDNSCLPVFLYFKHNNIIVLPSIVVFQYLMFFGLSFRIFIYDYFVVLSLSYLLLFQ